MFYFIIDPLLLRFVSLSLCRSIICVAVSLILLQLKFNCLSFFSFSKGESGTMAELSTLSPSPPALGDPHAAPSIPPSSPGLPPPNSTATESPREVSIPKSSLFNDKALSGKTSAVLAGGSPLIPRRSSNPPDLTAEASLLSSVQEPAPGNEESAGKPPSPSEVAQASPSPDLNPGPNLYPNLQVTCNPNPVVEEAQLKVGQPQTTAGPNPAPAPPVLSSSSAAAAAEGEKPQPLQEAQNAPNEPPPLYPKPGTPNEARMGELPATPTRAEPHSPPLPLIQEPPLSFALPKPRPAPDTLSYLESASLMSGTLESLSGLGEDGSSVGSDSEINGLTVRRTDKYGFLGGNQYSEGG